MRICCGRTNRTESRGEREHKRQEPGIGEGRAIQRQNRRERERGSHRIEDDYNEERGEGERTENLEVDEGERAANHEDKTRETETH